MKIAAERQRAYQCTAVDYDFAFAFMVQRRFKRNRKGDRQRRSAPTQRLPKTTRPPGGKVRLTLQDELERQSNAIANTAVDFDENGHKLVYKKAKDGPGGDFWQKAAGKEIIELI